MAGKIDTADGFFGAEDTAPFSGGKGAVLINAVAQKFADSVEKGFSAAAVQSQSLGVNASGKPELFLSTAVIAADDDLIVCVDFCLPFGKTVGKNLHRFEFQSVRAGGETEKIFYFLHDQSTPSSSRLSLKFLSI